MKPNIVQVLTDPYLLGGVIRDTATWLLWLAFFRIAYALPTQPGDMEILERHTGRTVWPTARAREVIFIIGARGGKSRAVSFLGLFEALFTETDLVSGELAYLIIVCPTRKQGSIIKSYLASYFRDIPFFRPFLVKETTEELWLSNGVVISILASDYRSLRGFTGLAGIIDEAAFLHIDGQRPALEVARALKSRLITTKGPLVSITTPYSKSGYVFDCYSKYWGVNDAPVLVFKATSLEANPSLDAQLIEQELAADCEGALAEYGYDFRSDVSQLLTPEVVDACTIPNRHELPRSANVSYGGFLDPAAGSGKDSMCLAVGHREPNGVRVLDALREVKPKFDPLTVVEEFSQVLRSYGVSQALSDKFGGEWVRQPFLEHDIQINMAAKPKAQLYAESISLFNSHRVELLDHPRLRQQLMSLERKTRSGGRDLIDCFRGHDDLSNVACGLFVAVLEDAPVGDGQVFVAMGSGGGDWESPPPGAW